MVKKPYTLIFIFKEDQILLGMKKRGFGAGRWNGFGGKVHEGETIEEAARRETKEECEIAIMQMEKVGIHHFRFANNPEEVLEVHVFWVDTYTGEPMETEEMRPQWFSVKEVPYDAMWPDDRYWLPLFLDRKKFRTEFLFGEGDTVLEQNIQVVETLDE